MAEGKERSKVVIALAALGPGIVTAMAGNDAGGISTYSTAGAEYGYATLWVIPLMCVLLIVVEMTATIFNTSPRTVGNMNAMMMVAMTRSSTLRLATARGFFIRRRIPSRKNVVLLLMTSCWRFSSSVAGSNLLRSS